MNINSAIVQSTLIMSLGQSGGLGSRSNSISVQDTDTYSNGTGANQANVVFDDSRTLAAGANEVLDLSGILKDDFGNTITATSVVDIYVHLDSNFATSGLAVGNTGTNGFVGPFGSTAGVVNIPRGGRFHASNPVTGWPVTAGTADLLKITNLDGSNPANYRIIITARE